LYTKFYIYKNNLGVTSERCESVYKFYKLKNSSNYNTLLSVECNVDECSKIYRKILNTCILFKR